MSARLRDITAGRRDAMNIPPENILIDGECRCWACLELIQEGVEIKTVPALAKQTVRQRGSEAGKALKEEVAKAKAAGKKRASRSKGEGKVAKVQKTEKNQIQLEREAGDKMAELVLEYDNSAVEESLLRAARRWQKLRGQ